ncbi:MAG: HEAT repeat domain-containing protein [Planctomycetota bacterium]
MQRFLAWLVPVVLVGLAAAAAGDDTVKDFKKLFRKFKESADRVDAVLALEGIQSPDVVEALLPILRDKDAEVRDAAVRVLAKLSQQPALTVLETEFAKAKKDEVVLGLLTVYERSGRAVSSEEGLERVEDCLDDRDWQLRWRAARSLPTLTPELADARLAQLAGEDEELAVRCAAIDSLARLATDRGVDVSITALESVAWQERASAIALLGSVRRQRSIGPLVARIQVEEGRLIKDIGDALGELTGKAYGTRVARWREWWRRFESKFVMPTDEELAKLREIEARNEADYGKTEDVDYYGIETPSTRMLFVVDVSGSMDNFVVDRENFDGDDYRSWRRIDVVRRELQKAVEALEENVEFNILAFSRDLDPWRAAPVAANVLQKQAAIEWLGSLETVGGVEDKELASAGLVSAADLEAGRTNSYAALMYSLGVIDAKGRKLDADDYDLDLDTVFFLSDGVPSVGDFVDPDDILREVRMVNETRKVAIHTLALGQFRKSFMELLAEQNGGTFVDLGR